MKHILTFLFTSCLLVAVSAQNNPGQFEMQVIDGPMCNQVTVQMRAVGDVMPFHTDDSCPGDGSNTILLDLTYTLMWEESTGITNAQDVLNLECSSGGDGYHNVDVGSVVTVGSIKLKGFASGCCTPFDFPYEWPLNVWQDITVINLVGITCLDGDEGSGNLATLVGVVPYGQFGAQYYPNISMDIIGDDGGLDYTPAIVDAPLPLSLLSFYAKKEGERSSALIWSTTDEHNVNHFSIERSTDRSNWQEIAKVKAVGETSAVEHYQYLDQNVYDGRRPSARFYYRLKVVDYDGKSSPSNIQIVLFDQDPSATDVYIYPNPATDGVVVEFNYVKDAVPAKDILLYNELGQLVYKQEVQENSVADFVDFKLANINSGNYTIQVLDATNNILSTDKIVVQR